MPVPSRARPLLVALVSAVLVMAGVAAPAAAADERGRILVRVVDTAGAPAPGVLIGLRDRLGQTSIPYEQSDAEGMVDFWVEPGTNRWSVINPETAAYLSFGGPAIAEVAPGATSEVTHVITRPAYAAGRVVDHHGVPQSGVVVWVLPLDKNISGGSRPSASDGTWTSNRLRPGRYALRPVAGTLPRHAQMPASDQQVVLREGETTRADVQLQPAGAAVGRVLDANGRPVVDAAVKIVEHVSGVGDRLISDAVTEADGRFMVPRVKLGSWEVHVSHFPTGTSYVDRSGIRFAADEDTQLGDLVLRSKPVNIEKPTVVGDPRVGSTLRVDPGTWSEDDLELSYQWIVEDYLFVASEEPTYVPTPDMIGRRISVRVSARQEHGPATVVESEKTVPVPALEGKVRSIGPPVITGTPRLGSTLKVSSGTWSPSGLSYGYQWFMDGAAIDGATQATYTPTPGAVGKILMVRVTAGKPGFAEASRLSDTTDAVVGPVEVVRPPSLVASEQPVVGETVTVDRGYWRPSRLTWSYVWVRDGAAISSSTPGSRSSSYTLTSADWGKNVAVRVSGERAGFGVQRRYTESVFVKRRPSMSNTTEVLGDGTVRLTAKVVVVGATNPVGAVKVLEDGEEVATMPTMVKGVSTLTLSERTPGVHTYTLAYEGNRLVVPASRERTVTVR